MKHIHKDIQIEFEIIAEDQGNIGDFFFFDLQYKV